MCCNLAITEATAQTNKMKPSVHSIQITSMLNDRGSSSGKICWFWRVRSEALVFQQGQWLIMMENNNCSPSLSLWNFPVLFLKGEWQLSLWSCQSNRCWNILSMCFIGFIYIIKWMFKTCALRGNDSEHTTSSRLY